jgi:hypothetical protein
MKDAKEQRKHLLTAVAIVGGGGIVLFVFTNASGARASSSSRAPSRSTPARGVQVQPHSLNFGPNPAQPQVDEALIAAREAALAIYDQSAAAEHGQTTQYQLGVNQDVTAKAIAANTNATQLKETGITTTAAQAIAEYEARTQLQETQAATSAYQSVQSGAQSTSLWESIIHGIFSALPFLQGASGTTLPTASPVQYGSSAFPPTQYAVPDPVNPWG